MFHELFIRIAFPRKDPWGILKELSLHLLFLCMTYFYLRFLSPKRALCYFKRISISQTISQSSFDHNSCTTIQWEKNIFRSKNFYKPKNKVKYAMSLLLYNESFCLFYFPKYGQLTNQTLRFMHNVNGRLLFLMVLIQKTTITRNLSLYLTIPIPL